MRSPAAPEPLPHLLAAAFPFHLAVDAGGLVAALGPSLGRACPELRIGEPVAGRLQVLSPSGVDLHPDHVGDHQNRLVLLSARDGALTLRGQVTVTGGDRRDRLAVFLGSPWVTSADQLVPLGLSLADFAVHDPAADFLLLLQAQTSALADAERMAARLADAAAEQIRLVAAERSLAAELDAIPDLMLRLDARCELLEVRPARDGQLPAPAPELIGTTATALFTGWAAELPRAVTRALGSRATQRLSFTELVTGPSGEGRALHHEARVSASGPREVLVLVRDVTERRELEEQLTRQAFTDPLTGLGNRALLHDRVTQVLARRRDPRRRQQAPVLLLIDLDEFKTVNDTLGHPAGDRLLVVLAERLRATARAGDTVARLGGDEFAVLLPSGGERAGRRLAGRLLDALAEAVPLGERTVHPRASVGVATAGAGPSARWGAAVDADALLRNADLAMYAAKNAGKHRWVAYHAELHTRLDHRLALESDLRSALAGGAGAGLGVHYQPVVELAGGTVTGVEALARWSHPTRGAVPPVEFVPLAEECGLVGALGRWVLAEACEQTAVWNRGRGGAPPLSVAVNLSPSHLAEPDLCQQVVAALDAAGLPPSQLVVEITESALVDPLRGVLDQLAGLRALGVRLALDDFGTGHSSLGRLRALPVDILKVDRSFTAALDTGGERSGRSAADHWDLHDDLALTQAIIDLGHALQLSVVAEGIESTAQLEHLRRLGCGSGQGFLLGRPAPAAALGDLLSPPRTAAAAHPVARSR